MYGSRREKGSVTIFLLIVIASLITIFVSIFSVINNKYNEVKEERVLRLSTHSLLASYDMKLFKDYGLLALSFDSNRELEKHFYKNIFNNGIHNENKFEINFNQSLADNLVFENQIDRYIKSINFDTTYMIADMISQIESLNKLQSIVKKKEVIDKLIFSVEKLIFAIRDMDFEEFKLIETDVISLNTKHISYLIDKNISLLTNVLSVIEAIEELQIESYDLMKEKQVYLKGTIQRLQDIDDSVSRFEALVQSVEKNIATLYAISEAFSLEGIDEKSLVIMMRDYLIPDVSFINIFDYEILEDMVIKQLDIRNLVKGLSIMDVFEIIKPDVCIDPIKKTVIECEKNSLHSFSLEEAISFISSFKNIENNFLLNNYIMSTFSHENAMKSGRFFINEVEYILAGHDSQNMNMRNLMVKVLSIRSVLNYVAIYQSNERREMARCAGYTIAAITGGAGGECITNALIGAFAVYEAYMDVKNLLAGGKVALYKGNGDFSLAFLNIGNDYSSMIKTKYEHYLYFLLGLVSKEKKIDRMQDLIFLATNKDLHTYYTGVRGCVDDEIYDFSY